MPQAEGEAFPHTARWSLLDANGKALVHGYDNVDFDILWQIVTQALPPLIVQLEKIVLGGQSS
ncbi:MAG: HepT-like ribonuclease domain-containing protein [Candidatus Entotheonellia bacterium]